MERAWLIIAVLFCGAACKKDDFDINNLNGGKIIAQGHGGMGIHSTYPLDSPASILTCLHSGADGVEIDVQMTKDSVLIAYHSADLGESTDMSGAVVAHTWAELKQARFIGVAYTEHRLMRLEDLFTNLDDPQAFYFSLDLKPHPNGEADATYDLRFANALVALLQRHGVIGNVLIESQQPYLLSVLQSELAELKLMIYPPTFEEGLATATQMGLFGISIDMAKINADQVAQAHARGLWVALWNAESKALNREAIGMNPEIIQSDRLDHLVGLLD